MQDKETFSATIINGQTVLLNTTEGLKGTRPLPDSSADATGRLEVDRTVPLRAEIQNVIRRFNSDPAKAALAICVMLDERLDLAEKGCFDDDEVVQDAIISADLQDD